MATKQQGKQFTANVKVTAVVGVALKAKTLEDALAEGRTLGVTDAISLNMGDHIDSNFSLLGVQSDEWVD